MNAEDVTLLLALLGGTVLAAAALGRRTGDAPRDMRLMSAVGVLLSALSGGIYLLQ